MPELSDYERGMENAKRPEREHVDWQDTLPLLPRSQSYAWTNAQLQDPDFYPEPPIFNKNPRTPDELYHKKTQVEALLQAKRMSEPDGPFLPQPRGPKVILETKPEGKPIFNPMGLGESKEINPFETREGDPFLPPEPSFFSTKGSVPLPANINAPERREWKDMDPEEKRDFYYERKEDFIEYLEESFPVRMEQMCRAACKPEIADLERCYKIKNLAMGYAKWSTARGGLLQIYACTPFVVDISRCYAKVDNMETDMILRRKDEETLLKYFPK